MADNLLLNIRTFNAIKTMNLENADREMFTLPSEFYVYNLCEQILYNFRKHRYEKSALIEFVQSIPEKPLPDSVYQKGPKDSFEKIKSELITGIEIGNFYGYPIILHPLD